MSALDDGTITMKANLHPATYAVSVVCSSCGSVHELRSTAANLSVEVCGACHPATTGRQRVASSGGRIARFERKRAVVQA